MPRTTTTSRVETERRILESAAELVSRSGLEELSMRSVALAAGVQTPALYRVFDDKDALLRRLTAFAYESYFAAKRETLTIVDPIGDLERGWDLHVAFGLANPHLYPLMFGGRHDQASTGASTAADDAYAMLADVLRRIAAQGKLTTSVDDAAVRMYAATVGATFFLLGSPPDRRDPALVASLRDSVTDSLIIGRQAAAETEPPLSRSVRAVLTNLSEADPTNTPGDLRPTEIALLLDWLERIIH